MKFSRHLRSAAFILSLSVGIAACGGGDKDEFGFDSREGEGGGGSTQAAAVDPATAATVTGVVNFEGAAPAPSSVKMESDPVCSAAAPNESAEVTQEVVVNDGKLGNVFVYVSSGLDGKSFPAPSDPVTLNQEGCRYHPHVLGVMVGQPIKIKNSDATLHNVHATPTKNAAFNMAQPTQGMEAEKTFDKEEVMVPVSCDVHGWMRSYIGVLPHPYFSTTGADGAFSLKNLPPGDYTITAWHEKYGTKEEKVTVGASETKNISFTFNAQ